MFKNDATTDLRDWPMAKKPPALSPRDMPSMAPTLTWSKQSIACRESSEHTHTHTPLAQKRRLAQHISPPLDGVPRVQGRGRSLRRVLCCCIKHPQRRIRSRTHLCFLPHWRSQTLVLLAQWRQGGPATVDVSNNGVDLRVNFATMSQTTARSNHQHPRPVIVLSGSTALWYWIKPAFADPHILFDQYAAIEAAYQQVKSAQARDFMSSIACSTL